MGSGIQRRGDRTMVAAPRAMATRADNPLINDPFAEPPPYLTNRGWLLTTTPLPELRAASGLAPVVEQDLPAVEMVYISGTLYKTH